MRLRSFIAGVGLAATANAILLPPDFTIAGDTVNTLPVPTEVDTDTVLSKVPDALTVNLECPGCLHRGRRHGKEIPSHLKLDFKIESTDGADRFTLNGYELYPNPDPLRSTLTAPLISDMAGRREGHPWRLRGGRNRPQKNQPLGFAMETGAVATDNDENLQLVNVEIQIVEVGNVFIKNIPSVEAKLVKSPSGKLAIGTIGTSSQSAAGNIHGTQKECSTTICRWKALLFDKLSRIFAFKGCGGSKAMPSQHGHHHGNHGHGHGYPSHQVGRKHGFVHGLSIFVTHILLPILIGIVAGISASIIGVLAGNFVVFMWRLLFRRGSPRSYGCRSAREAVDGEVAAEEEKSGLLNDEEQIEAPPAYVESNLVVPEEKKSETEA